MSSSDSISSVFPIERISSTVMLEGDVALFVCIGLSDDLSDDIGDGTTNLVTLLVCNGPSDSFSDDVGDGITDLDDLLGYTVLFFSDDGT